LKAVNQFSYVTDESIVDRRLVLGQRAASKFNLSALNNDHKRNIDYASRRCDDQKGKSLTQSLFTNVNIGVILLQYYSIKIERNVQQKTTQPKIIIRI